MATAAEVANYIVKRFQEAGDPVTNLKLQKLLYYVQGWHLGLTDEPAFEGRFEAWAHGPVCPDIYHRFKSYRWNPIVEDVGAPKLDRKLVKHIEEVLEVYGDDSGWQLERRSHREAPWIKARDGLPPDAESTEVVTERSMGKFFRKEAREN